MGGVEVLRYAAFTTDPAGGNPAGVVLLDEELDAPTMQAIAAEVGYSETAFLGPPGDDGARPARYFTPEVEVDFCGHATIAAGVALAERDPDLTRLTLRTAAGAVALVIERGAEQDHVPRATLTSPPTSLEPVSGDTLAATLATFGWSPSSLDPEVPPVVAGAGTRHLVVALQHRAALDTLAFDRDHLTVIQRREGWTTLQLVWRERPDLWHARDPAPGVGIDEDPATGAAAAALGGYLRASRQLPADHRFTIIQGEALGRRSVIEVEARPDEPGVRVTGHAVPIG